MPEGWKVMLDSLLQRGMEAAWALNKVLLAVLIGLLLHWLAVHVARELYRRVRWGVGEGFFRKLKWSSRLLFPLLAVQAALAAQAPETSSPELGVLRHGLSLTVIALGCQLIVSLLWGIEEHIKNKHRVDVPDNYAARRVHTQVTVLRRSAVTFVIVVGLALALMTFPRVRQLGASLLASAGLVGLVIGLAARPIVENLIAGVQIALTQPINIDDVVIIEGEWGWIEEIRATYVVVRIWDQRRLIVPFSKFIQEPFQNWTRRTAELLGAVTLYADYTLPVQAVREELERIVQGCDKWDGRVCNLQVVDATEQTIQLRALVSAASSPAAWDLRVEVREKLIAYLQREHPHCLPRTRLEIPPTEEARLPAKRSSRAA